MIKGMALPILFFPSTLLNAVSTLLIPEISEAEARNRHGLVRSATRNILKLTSVIAFIFGAIFFVGGRKIGLLIYKSPEVGELLRALSPIVPLMYLDSISDGILKGLDQQAFTFLILLPIFGLRGFIWIMYFSNVLTCFLNVGRLLHVTRVKIRFINEILLPLTSAAVIAIACDRLLGFWGGIGNLVYIILLCIISLPLYFGAMLMFKVVSPDDLRSFLRK